MPLFQYTATSPDGQLVTSEIEAETVADAVEQLLDRQLRIQSIQEIMDAEALPGAEAAPELLADRPEVETILHEQIARILENGSAVAPALEAYAAELSSREERSSILELAEQIRQGNAISPSPESSPGLANRLWTRLACAAAVSASPARLVRSLMTLNGADASRARTVSQMLIYPALVFFASLALFGGFANLIAPGFQDVFESFGTDLPPLTSLVLRTAAVVELFGWWWFAVIAIIAAFSTWPIVFQKTTGQNRRSRVRTFTESLADLIEADVASPTAIRLAAMTTDDTVIHQSAEHWATCIQQKLDPNNEPNFGLPRSLIHAVTATDTHAGTANLLRELAVIYRRSDRRGQNLLIAALEPCAIIFVALFAGFVLFSLLLPLTSLIQIS